MQSLDTIKLAIFREEPKFGSGDCRMPQPTADMEYIDEYRNPEPVLQMARIMARITRRPWTIMEICGGQTHAIMRHGLNHLLPPSVNLVHGPGCPVCVTPLELVDKAILLATRPEVIFCSFGDMLRVPGSETDLLSVKARGGDVRIVYSPLDAVKLAQEHPDKQVVFFAVGFETTAPANGMAVLHAHRLGLQNFSLLVSHVLVPPAMRALLGAPGNLVQGFLAAGHVCTVMGFAEYEPIARQFHVPIVVTGFEPLDILEGICGCLRQLEEGRAEVENAYARLVKRDGNPTARQVIDQVFRVIDRKWRGIGVIPLSGLGLADIYRAYDAEKRFGLAELQVAEPPECISGLILQGTRKPIDCPAFGTRCTPEHPLGATMVSSEGACSAYYRYHDRRRIMAKS
jgi:hydrogenase expression/formation protein HypD